MNSTSDLEPQAARALKPYPAYKDSGVEWLGEVPAHWEVRAAKWYFREADDRSDTGSEELLSVSHVTGVTLRSEKNVTMFRAESNIGHKLCIPGDIVVNTMWAWMGALGIARQTGIVSPSYAVYRPRRSSRLHGEYADLLLRTRAYKNEYVCRSTGIRSSRLRLYPEQFLRITLLCPPPEEQAAIVRFLDHADRRIRRYILAKEKLIALLEEQKQATIHQAVTGQIDVRTGQPYPAYKPSGVEWLGDVPKHWEVLRLGRLITLTVGFPFKSGGFTQADDDMRLLRGVNIAPGRIRWDDLVRWPVTDLHTFADYRVEVGDIVLGMDRPIVGDGVRVAVAAQADVPSLLLQRVARVRPGQELLRDFALRLLGGNSLRDYLAPIFTGISVPHLSPEQIKGFWLALPSVGEQEAIVENLRSRVGAFQCAMHGALEEIALLREYRTRLIADVVTGKLDVREAAAGLPDDDPFARDHALDGGEEADDLSTSGGEVGATESEEVDNLVRDGRDAPGRPQVPA